MRRFNCVGLDSPAWAMWRFRARVKGRSKSSISLVSWHSIKLGTAKAVGSVCSQRVSCSQPSVFRLPASGCQRLFDLVDKETGSRTISWLVLVLLVLVPGWAYTSPSAIEMTCSSPEGTVSQMGLPYIYNSTQEQWHISKTRRRQRASWWLSILIKLHHAGRIHNKSTNKSQPKLKQNCQHNCQQMTR